MTPTPSQAEPTIYRSAEAERRIHSLYDEFVAGWPLAVSESDAECRWGNIHGLSWGPEDGPALLLCHAASMAATSWLPNAAALAGAGYRCHAVDYPGEANRSRLADRDTYPKSGTELGELYAGIMDSLGLDRAPVIAASAGGHVALRLALTAPERVSHLGLLGPMGITSLGLGAMVRMMVASMVPTAAVAAHTSRWALGTAPSVTDGYGGWFSAVLESVASPPRVARPIALNSEELARVSVPVMLVLGDHDNLVGDPEKAASKAAALPDVRIEALNSGHLVAVERADEVNALLVDFLPDAADA
jgi:pimeloyl-ACP methyl ester carboxylesterase